MKTLLTNRYCQQRAQIKGKNTQNWFTFISIKLVFSGTNNMPESAIILGQCCISKCSRQFKIIMKNSIIYWFYRQRTQMKLKNTRTSLNFNKISLFWHELHPSVCYDHGNRSDERTFREKKQEFDVNFLMSMFIIDSFFLADITT